MRYAIQGRQQRYYRYTSRGTQWHIDLNKATLFDSKRAALAKMASIGNGETFFLVPVRTIMVPDLVTVHGTRKRRA